MIPIDTAKDQRGVPKPQKARRGYAEEADEAPALVREEPADMQRETPDQGNIGIERDASDDSDTSAFDE